MDNMGKTAFSDMSGAGTRKKQSMDAVNSNVESGSLHTQATASQTRRQVELEDEAIERRAAELPEAKAPAPPPNMRQLIAVRVGIPEVKPITVDQLLRDSLTERAAIREVGDLLKLDDAARAEPEVEVELLGSGRENGAEPVRLPGQGANSEAASERPAPVPRTARMVSTPTLRQREAVLPTPPAADLQEPQEIERQSFEQGTNPENIAQATAVAPHSTVIQNNDEVHLPGQSDEPAGQKVAQETFTHAGVVEAASADQLATRFFNGLPATDPGAEPRVEEDLSERSVPASTLD